jgi:hypothetical protein
MNEQRQDNAGNNANSDSVGAQNTGLQDIRTRRFSVWPDAIVVGEDCVVSWDVVFGETVDAKLRLNGAFVTTVGTQHFRPTQTTIFKLSVVFPDGTERGLVSDSVRVDPVGCTDSLVQSVDMTEKFEKEINKRFNLPGKISLRGNGSVVSFGTGQISISVPAEINVPDWFDADLNLTIELFVRFVSSTGDAPLSVTEHSVDFEVDWSFLENLVSLGCGHFVEMGMTELGQVLMENMIYTEVAPLVTDALNFYANQQRAIVRAQDPQRRPLLFTHVAISPDGLNLRLCPA